MNTQLKPLAVRAAVAVIAVIAVWRFGVQVNEQHLTQTLDMALTGVFGWLALRKPGDVPVEAVKEAEDRASRIPRAPIYALAFAFLLPQLTACAGNIEQTTRATLNTLQAVADPAYETAVDLCIAQERAVVDKVKAEGFKPAYSAEFEAISARCHKTREAFEVIRALHTEAAKLVDGGQIAEAQEKVAALLAAWQALKKGGGS